MENDSDTEDINETVTEEKVLVFNPAGVIVKLILSIVIAFLTTKSDYTDDDLLYAVFNSVVTFAGIYAIATLFGFLLRLTKNYLLAIILFVAACVGYGKLYEFATSNSALEIVFNIVFTVILIVIIVRDIRKAVLYFKYTV